MQCKHTYSSFLSWIQRDPICRQVASDQVDKGIPTLNLFCWDVRVLYGIWSLSSTELLQLCYIFSCLEMIFHCIVDFVCLLQFLLFFCDMVILFLHFYYIIVNFIFVNLLSNALFSFM